MNCPKCGSPIDAACGWHGEHWAVNSHQCRQGGTIVECPCGVFAWGIDTADAMRIIGGSFQPPVEWRP